MLAAAAGVAGTAATDYLLLNFDASLVDSDFTGMSGLDQIILRGTGAQSIALGETAAAAFGPGQIVISAETATSLSVNAIDFGAVRVVGTVGADTVRGGYGDDRFIGGAGADVFIYNGHGIDTFADFTPGTDKILLLDTGITSFAELLSHVDVRPNGGLHIDFSSPFSADILRLPTVTLGQLSANDFIFSTARASTGVTLAASPRPENAPGALNLGTLSVIDPDLGDTHTITSLHTGFYVSGNSLFLKEGATLGDYEAGSDYLVSLRVTDSYGIRRDHHAIVDLTNVVEPWGAQSENGGRTPNDRPLAMNLLANEQVQEFSVKLAAVSIGTFATAHGSVTTQANGAAVYTPNAGYVGTDSFTYVMSDALGNTSSATASFSAFTNLAPTPGAHGPCRGVPHQGRGGGHPRCSGRE